jgi:hypothetical protein
MWLWLAENPGSYKDMWPEWKHNNGKISVVDNYCFACAVSGICCPIKKWQHGCLKQEYGEWSSCNNPEDAKKLALTIANLEWFSYKEFYKKVMYYE